MKPLSKEEEASGVSFVGEGELKKFICGFAGRVLPYLLSKRDGLRELKPSSGTVSCAAKSNLLRVAISTGNLISSNKYRSWIFCYISRIMRLHCQRKEQDFCFCAN
ncbi:hypothetical protein AVEN_92786-1 [Araneus ventricosus]|uniref:Uncharacterized protein n=1 Tax=Araneus ventricosus TaxID=182803 RepID=A0A4Y2VB45_ARAVE|nr:hypothetical protein AVEN_92786-1 [Araneus ventricosus]